MSLYYYKDMFKVQDLEQAKNIILTEEQQGGDYRQRWERETEYMKTLFAGGLGDLSGKTVLDFGCGIGRLSKALLEQYDCLVLNLKHRAVPVIDSENGRKKFYIDEQPEASADVAALLEQQFTALSELELAAEKISVVTKHWCRVYGKKESK